jgi:hypothetical protein
MKHLAERRNEVRLYLMLVDSVHRCVNPGTLQSRTSRTTPDALNHSIASSVSDAPKLDGNRAPSGAFGPCFRRAVHKLRRFDEQATMPHTASRTIPPRNAPFGQRMDMDDPP